MSNISVCLIVEGQTEKTFVKNILAPEMARKGVYLEARIVGKPGHKGGNIRFERVKNDIKHSLEQRTDTYISTMLDYFRIDSNWPGIEKIKQKIKSGIKLNASEKADVLENETLEQLAIICPKHHIKERFIPYISMHEFEALLFSNEQVLADKLNLNIKDIQKILTKYDNPEEINDSPTTAPSKRLEKMMQGYKKIAMGKDIAEAIGIDRIREQCPHFNQWLLKLESLIKE